MIHWDCYKKAGGRPSACFAPTHQNTTKSFLTSPWSYFLSRRTFYGSSKSFVWVNVPAMTSSESPRTPAVISALSSPKRSPQSRPHLLHISPYESSYCLRRETCLNRYIYNEIEVKLYWRDYFPMHSGSPKSCSNICRDKVSQAL